jgi:hypothetical protein
MTENKTVATNADVAEFLARIEDPEQQRDSERLVEIMTAVSGEKPVLWGPSIIGFGTLQYKTADGKIHDWMRIGFSPRKGKLSLYVTVAAEKYADRLKEMGKHKTGKGCIYINKLSDVNVDKMTSIIKDAYSNRQDL